MRHADAFAGIGGFALAAMAAGMTTTWSCEIDPFARAVYEQRLGIPEEQFERDIRTRHVIPRCDILTGGWPCQDHSVAGRCEGLAGNRSGLFWELVAILRESRPAWRLFENVPGVFSTGDRRDFAVVLRTLADCGYRVGWRVLDAEFFGLAQGRARVFLVGNSRDSASVAAVLFDGETGERHPSSRGKTGKAIATTLGARASGGRDATDLDGHGALIAHTLTGEGCDASEDGTGRGTPLVAQTVTAKTAKGTGVPSGDECQNLIADPITANRTTYCNAGNNPKPRNLVAVDSTGITSPGNRSGEHPVAPTLNQDGNVLVTTQRIRRLTPNECERLQGYPDDWTLVEYRGKPAKDTPRYRVIGNAVAVPVVTWLMRRIAAVEQSMLKVKAVK